jgi:copper homeostasis protein
MPGAGVRSTNIEKLIKETGAAEYHTSARISIPNNVSYQNPEILDIGGFYLANEEELRRIMVVLEK